MKAHSNRANAAANNVAEMSYTGAINVLNSLLDRVDGNNTPKDWISDFDERNRIVDVVTEMIIILYNFNYNQNKIGMFYRF